MASETDYATDLDILLEAEDEPYDGLAAMVQIWNKVECFVHPEQRVLGQLTPARLAAMVAAFADHALSHAVPEPFEPVPARPGSLIERLTSTGKPVLCGTPLGGARDERRHYQTLYGVAADLVKQAARLAVEAQAKQEEQNRAAAAAPASTTWVRNTWGKLVGSLRDLAAELGGALTPLVPEAAMNNGQAATSAGKSPATAYRVAGLIQIEQLPAGEGRSLKLRLTRLSKGSLVLRLMLDGDTLKSHTLDDHQPAATLFIEPAPGLVLHIQDPHGGAHQWNLAP